MSGGGMNVNRDSLVQRLQSLNISQQSIEGTSKWCLFYIKDAKTVVNIWLEEFSRTTSERRIAFLYLANHILQEGRKKGREFADEFFRVLPKALASVSRSSDAKLRSSAKRLVDIWDERKVFGSSQVRVLKDHLNGGGGGGTPSKPGSASAAGGAGAGAAAADGTAGSSGGGSSELDRRKLAAVGSLADVLYEVANAAARSSEWQTKCLQIKANVSSVDASLSEVAAARTTLETALECLKAESERRKKAVTYIRMHLSQQEDSLKRTEDAHAALTAQKAELDERHAVLLKQEQEQQEREQREREREEAFKQQQELQLQQQQQQKQQQQQQQQQEQQQQQQQKQQQASIGGMGPDGGAAFMGMPPGGMPGMPPMMPPPFPLPGMDPSAPPFGLPGLPPFPAALLGAGGMAPPGMNPLAALAGGPGMAPLGPLPSFLGPLPGMNPLNLPPGMNPLGGPGGAMNPMGSGGVPPGAGGGGPMGQLPGGLPDLAGALSALSASGFGGAGGGGDPGSTAANGHQHQQKPQLQSQSSGGGGMPQQGSGSQGPGGMPPQHGGSGSGLGQHLPPPQQHQQHPGPPPHHHHNQQQQHAGGLGHHHHPPGGPGGPPPPSVQPPSPAAGGPGSAAAGPPGGGVAPPPLDSAGIDQLAAALANNSDQTAMLLANAFASMSQEERDRLGANLGDMLGSGGPGGGRGGGGGGPGPHPPHLQSQPSSGPHQMHGHPPPPGQHPHPPPQFPLPPHPHNHHHPQHHPQPPAQQPQQTADHSFGGLRSGGGGFGGSPMGNGDGDLLDAPYDPEFPD